MRPRLHLVALVVWCSLMTATVPSGADQLDIGLDQLLDVQSNPFRDTIDPQPDGRYRFRPIVRVRRDDTNFTYRLNYSPVFVKYFDTTALDGWDQFVQGVARYRVTSQDTLRLSGSFSQFRAITTTTVDDPVGEPVVLRDDTGLVRRFFADLGYTHSFTPRVSGTLTADVQRFAFERSNNVDNTSLSGLGSLTYAWGPRLVLGGSFLARYRVFDRRGTIPGSTTSILNPNAIVQLELGETLDLNLQGGPSFVLLEDAEARPVAVPRYFASFNGLQVEGSVFDSGCGQVNGQRILVLCPRAPASSLLGVAPDVVVVGFAPGQRPEAESSTNITYFLLAEIEKRFARGSTSLRYQRSEDAAAGTGTSTLLDIVTGQATWRPGELWTARLLGVWSRRTGTISRTASVVVAGDSGLVSDESPPRPIAESVGLVALPDLREFEVKQFFIDFSVARQVTERTNVKIFFQYQQQQQSFDQTAAAVRVENYMLGATLSFMFDPVRF